ncbi:hypothetical protein ETH_00020670 [Eimeria tenella]|uniref:Uncharacterized protein n=1 Tax=Eimeria tenella TaxID=5802 RepID=U6KWN5_EIMTE|nr:hypothetical protein ETH_00020670 [Eimeria tenella]CDJ42386.1 hypothetical protein ETH_00020670 [Eimeria tenella]|eukprot:XP_013233136.1 hypothetical protein ETH_00020670 [Eimeria tenella]
MLHRATAVNGWVTQRNFGFKASTRSSTNLLFPLPAGAFISLLWKTLFLLQTVAILATGEAPVETPGENRGETPGETESTASTESLSTETKAALSLSVSTSPELDVAVGELRDDFNNLVDAYPFLSATALEAFTSVAKDVTENLQALQKGEKEVNINTLAHEAPSWMVFQLKELAVTEHVLKSVTVHQYENILDQEKARRKLKEEGHSSPSQRHLCAALPWPEKEITSADRDAAGYDLSPEDLDRVGEARLNQLSNLKDKLSAGGRPVDYYGAVEWMACPVVAHTFMSTYMENSRDFTGVEEPPRGLTITKRWLEGPQFQRTLQDLMDNQRIWATTSPIVAAVWILKASATQRLRGMAPTQVKRKKAFGLSGLCSKKCERLFAVSLSPERPERPKDTVTADVLRLFLFHHLRLVQLAEASLERTFAALLLETSDVCGISDGSVTCSEAKQLVAAPVDPEDPQFAVPDFLRQLDQPRKEAEPWAALHPTTKRKRQTTCILEAFAVKGGHLGKRLQALKAIQAFEATIASMASEKQGPKALANPYLLCQTLWTRAREMHAGSNAFARKAEQWKQGGDSLGAVLLALFQSQPKWRLPRSYAPLTSVCMQTAGFLHSIVEEYAEKEGLFRSLGRSVLRVGSAVVKRLAGKKQRVARKPSDWVNLELTMQPASGASLAAYRGALEVIYALATEARKLFLEPAVEAPHSLKEFVGILMGLWTQRQLPSFSFASNDISVARKTFLLAAILHEKGHIGYAVDIVMEAAGRLPGARAIDFGRVSYLGNFEYELTGAVVSLRKRGQVPLTRANLEDFFIEIAAGSADPVDMIRVAVDLAHTLLASQISQKGSRVLSGVAIMQTEASLRFHCAGLQQYIIGVAKSDLAKETPEAYQDYLNALFATAHVARISQVDVKSRKRVAKQPVHLQLSCPFMSSYINEAKRKERQAVISLSAIHTKTPLDTKLLFVFAEGNPK